MDFQNFENRGIQQDDNYRQFMGWITDGGLRYAFAKRNGNDDLYRRQVDPKDRRKVIVVGAGMSGLAAAYEPAQIGHEVTILEEQSRVGGRVKTLREGFAPGLHCEGWDAKLMETENLKEKLGIKGIQDYYKVSVEKIKEELGSNPTWFSWIEKWSNFSLEDYLRSNTFQKPNEPQLRPWPNAAIEALKVSTYTPTLGKDLVTYLRIQFGEWRDEHMYAPILGMDELPVSFVRKNENGWNKSVDLSKNLKYAFMVTKVENINEGRGRNIKVIGKNKTSGREFIVYGDVVFLTVPVQALRRMDIPLTIGQKKALDTATYIYATKIHLQCRRRFWQTSNKDDENYRKIDKNTSNGELQGGFSITDQQIGRLHYPDYVKSGIKDDERGILEVYALGDNALTLGSEKPETAIARAISQISKIHPEIEDEFEVGAIQAWHNDQTTLCACADLNPFHYIDSMKMLSESTETIYIAGDTLSWSKVWIQGAIFSGLFQAYCFQSRVEGCTSHCNLVSFIP